MSSYYRQVGLCLGLLSSLLLLVGQSGSATSVAQGQEPPVPGSLVTYLPQIINSNPPQVVADVSLLALPNQLPASVAKSTSLRALVRDEVGQPIANREVEFGTQLGRFSNDQSFISTVTDENGQAIVQLFGVPELGPTVIAAQADDIQAQTTVTLVPDACNDIEDNDVPNQASAQPSSICDGSLEDDPQDEDDYYFVRLNPGQEITVNLTEMPPGADYDLTLYGLNYENPSEGLVFVAFSNQNGAANESLTYVFDNFDEPAFFYIDIWQFTKSDQAENTYRLEIELDPLESNQPQPVLQSPLPPQLSSLGDPPRPPRR